MKKVKVLRAFNHNGARIQVGDTLEFDDFLARALVNVGKCKFVDEGSAKKSSGELHSPDIKKSKSKRGSELLSPDDKK